MTIIVNHCVEFAVIVLNFPREMCGLEPVCQCDLLNYWNYSHYWQELMVFEREY